MKSVDFLEAMSIISYYHTTKIVLNRVITQTVQVGVDKVRLELTHCNVGCTQALQKNGFKLSMNEGHLLVDRY